MQKGRLVLTGFLLLALLIVFPFISKTEAGETAKSLPEIADELFLKYQYDTRQFDALLVRAENQEKFDRQADMVRHNLEQYCAENVIDQYIDTMTHVYRYQEYEPTYAKSDILLKSRVIRSTDDYVVVRQWRELTEEDTEWGGKGHTYRYAQYVFLEKKGETWKLAGVTRALAVNDIQPDETVEGWQYGDIDGEGVKENVFLVLKKYNPEDAFAFQIRVKVNGGIGEAQDFNYTLNPRNYAGYEAKIQLADLNGDKLADVFISMGTGGSSGASLYGAFSLKDNQMVQLLNERQGLGLVPLQMSFLDDYQARIVNTEYGIDTILDLTDRKDMYEHEAFRMYKDGKLLHPEATPAVDPYLSLVPTDVDGDGQAELVGMQRIWGFSHADTLADFCTTLKYKDGKWQLVQYEIKKVAFK